MLAMARLLVVEDESVLKNTGTINRWDLYTEMARGSSVCARPQRGVHGICTWWREAREEGFTAAWYEREREESESERKGGKGEL